MKLNAGIGEFRCDWDGWVNLDYVHSPEHGIQPDVCGSVLQMPFKDDAFETAYCGHIVEHLPYDDILPVFLQELQRVVRSGSLIAFVAPDINRGRDMVNRGEQPDSLIKDIEAGAGRWGDGKDRHYWTCEEGILLTCLKDAGFNYVRPVSLNEVSLYGFPIVSKIAWQCAAFAAVP